MIGKNFLITKTRLRPNPRSAKMTEAAEDATAVETPQKKTQKRASKRKMTSTETVTQQLSSSAAEAGVWNGSPTTVGEAVPPSTLWGLLHQKIPAVTFSNWMLIQTEFWWVGSDMRNTKNSLDVWVIAIRRSVKLSSICETTKSLLVLFQPIQYTIQHRGFNCSDILICFRHFYFATSKFYPNVLLLINNFPFKLIL